MLAVKSKVLRIVPALVLVGGSIAAAIVLSSGSVHAGGFPPLPGGEANLPAAKAALLQQQAAEAAGAPRASKTAPPPAAAQPGTVPTGGIVNLPQGPFPYDVFAVQNSWGGEVGGQWIWVYAGQAGPENNTDGPNGGVALFSQPIADLVNGTGVTSLGFALVAGLADPLRITSVAGDEMTLTDSQGNVYTFDLSKLAFSTG